MRVLPPLSITDAMLSYTTVAEADYTAWASGTSYAVGDRAMIATRSSTVTISIASPGIVTWSANGVPDGTPVILTTTGALPTGLTAGEIYYVVNRATGTFQLSATLNGAAIVTTGSQSGTHTATAYIHRNYESLIGSNTGNPPPIDDGTKWLDLGPTNRWKMFDLLRSTGTEVASPLTVVVTPGERVDSIALVGMIADEVTIEVSSGGDIVYSYTENLNTRATVSWYTYFFGAFSYKAALALFDLPPYVDASITVTLTRATGNVVCGGLLMGRSVYIGKTLHNAESDALNYSTVDRDTFGDATLVPRRSVPKTVQRVVCDRTNVNRVTRIRTDLNAVPAIWSGLDDASHGYFEPLLILGVYRQFTIAMDQPDQATVTLELEEV